MTTIRYDKLVRDRIPEIIRSAKKTPLTRTASGAESRSLLEAKLQEETDELRSAAPAKRSEELADVLEVLHALARLEGLTPATLEALRARKAAERGGFEAMVVLETVEDVMEGPDAAG
jgi:predicted house-cleaning noncanonical NTP pyrophosphatase (MazG superfamily)